MKSVIVWNATFRFPSSLRKQPWNATRAGSEEGPGAPNENIVQNHLNKALVNVF